MKHFTLPGIFPLFLYVFFSCVLPAATGFSQTEKVNVYIAADSENAGYEAWRVMDRNSDTMWHTQYSDPPRYGNAPGIELYYTFGAGDDAERDYSLKKLGAKARQTQNISPHPHWLCVEMEKPCTLTGFVYTPRKRAENGTIKEYACFVTDTLEESETGTPAVKGILVGEKSDAPVRVIFEKPLTGRFFTLTSHSAASGEPFASIAELELLSDGKEFVLDVISYLGPAVARAMKLAKEMDSMGPEEKDRIQEFNWITMQFGRMGYYKEIKEQAAHPAALILDTDRDPADVIYRRVSALAADLITVLAETSSDLHRYRRVSELKSTLKTLESKVTEGVSVEDASGRFALFNELCNIRRELMFLNPLLDFNELLFVKKHRATFNHFCDQFYGINLVPGGGVFVLSDFGYGKTPKVRNILENAYVETGRLAGEKLDKGAFVAPDLSYDTKEISFAYVECEGPQHHLWHTDLTRGHWEQKRCFHIFKCNLDGTGLKMLTDGTWNDFDPVFLPNGRIAFVSERRGGYLRCGRECPTYTLFDMDTEGEKIRCLSYHETNEWNPSVTNDGKIIYTRWDYVDRFGCIAHHPWITTLNGSDSRAVHGNFTPRHQRSDAEFDCRAIPDSGKFVATAGPHHGQSFGSLVLIDPLKDDEEQGSMNAIKRITPDVGFPESQGGSQVYGTPYPLSEKYYLAVADFSQESDMGWQGGAYERGDYGIYLVDIFGNRELIYRDPEIGSVSPIPLKSRELPVVRPENFDPESLPHQPFVAVGDPDIMKRPQADVSVANVYQSLKPWPEGAEIKALRVMQIYCMSVPSGAPPHETGPREPSSQDSVNLVRGVLGIVPVEADGSAHFTVPAQTEMFFQALDENGLAVQSMRSATYFHPGDNVSCVGCHEPKHETPLQSSDLPLAFRRPPSVLQQETVPGARPVNFPQLVQPILDAHCVDCHAAPESVEKGAFSLAREPYRNKWYTSYDNLVNGGYAFYNYQDPLRTTPGKFGAHASKLYKILKDGHYDVNLSPEEMYRITLWLDSLSLFYGCYEKENGERQLLGEDVYPTLE